MSTFHVLLIALLVGVVILSIHWLVRELLTVVRERTLLERLRIRTGRHTHRIGQLLPYKATAYERLIIFLERINPHELIRQVTSDEVPPAVLRAQWIRQIRQEFQYNASQQLYISEEGWQIVENAVEQVILLINQAYHALDKDAGPHAFIGKIRDRIQEWETLPHQAAIDALKSEFRQFAES